MDFGHIWYWGCILKVGYARAEAVNLLAFGGQSSVPGFLVGRVAFSRFFSKDYSFGMPSVIPLYHQAPVHLSCLGP